MIKKFFIYFAIMGILTGISHAQSQFRLYDWKAHSSMNNVTDAASDSRGRLWAATDGGIFIYDIGSGEYTELRNVNQMIDLDINAIEFDAQTGLMVAGSADGTIELISEDLTIEHITDLRYSGLANTTINDIEINGDYIYVAGGFGLSVIDKNRKIFVEDVRKLGEFSGMEVRNIIIFNNEIWLATDQGIAKAKNDISQIRNPAVWQTFTSPDYIAGKIVVDFAVMDNSLYVATEKTLYKFEPADTTFTEIYNFSSQTIKDIITIEDDIYITTDLYVFDLNIKPKFANNILLNATVYLNINNGNKIFYLTESNGIFHIENADTSNIIPNTPLTNSFTDIALTQGGNFWTTGGRRGVGGIYFYNEGAWHSFLPKSYPDLKSSSYHQIVAKQNGEAVAMSWGSGVSKVIPAGNNFTIQHFDTTNSPFLGIPGSPGYVVTGESAIDNQGNYWIANWGGTLSGPVLIMLTEDGTFHSFENCAGSTKRHYLNIAIDNYGTKWLGSEHNAGQGLLYINDNNTPGDKSDDKCGVISTDDYQNLADDTQTALAVDQLGYLWVGTPNGVTQVINPNAALTANPNFILRKLNFSSIRNVTDIMVDALNNKWVATTKGVFVLDPEATEIIAEINKENSPMPSDEINALASDQATGRIYFATSKGIYEASSLSIKPQDDYTLKVYPQPFKPGRALKPGEENILTIEGLAPDTEIRITTINGVLIKSGTTTGNVFEWDGITDKNQVVESGVYMIIATSGTTDAKSVGKIAIIRQN